VTAGREVESPGGPDVPVTRMCDEYERLPVPRTGAVQAGLTSGSAAGARLPAPQRR